MAPERLALPAPTTAAGAEHPLAPAAATLPDQAPAQLVQLVPPAPPRSNRPHYIAAGICTAVLAGDALAWLLLRPLDERGALLLLLVATLAASILCGAVGSLSARPMPTRKADR
jgi:branched-subunit amino acid ABC-type transport system permease component